MLHIGRQKLFLFSLENRNANEFFRDFFFTKIHPLNIFFRRRASYYFRNLQAFEFFQLLSKLSF